MFVLCLKKLDEVKNYVIMIYVGGDNYFDYFVIFGGGGVCMVCGVIK